MDSINRKNAKISKKYFVTFKRLFSANFATPILPAP